MEGNELRLDNVDLVLAFFQVCLAGGARQWVTLTLASLSSSFLSHLECAALQALCQLVAPGLSPDLESTCRCEYPITCKTDYLYGCRIRILACYFYQIWQGVSRLLRLSVESMGSPANKCGNLSRDLSGDFQ